MTSELAGAVHEMLTNEGFGKLICAIKFADPKNRINLPRFTDGSDNVAFMGYKNADNHYWVLMTHGQTINQFEAALIRAVQREEVDHPQIIIDFKQMQKTVNCLEEPHRAFSPMLSEPQKQKNYTTYLKGTKNLWYESQTGKDFYSQNPVTRLKALMKHSPLTILFGGWGSHAGLASGPKYMSLVETEIFGLSLSGSTPQPRRGHGAYMPPVTISPDFFAEKGDASKLGYTSVPHAPQKALGAAVMSNIVMEGKLILDRLSDLWLGKDEQRQCLNMKMYLVALWLDMFWMGWKRGFDHYQGRELTPLSVDGKPPAPEFSILPETSYPKMTTALKKINASMCREFHKDMFRIVEKDGLVTKKTIYLEASPELDKDATASLRSNGSKKESKAKTKKATVSK